jgi:hypothetical protein
MFELFALALLVPFILLSLLTFKIFGFVFHLVLLPLKIVAGLLFGLLLLPLLLFGLPFLLIAGVGAVVAFFLLVLFLVIGGIIAIAGLLSI